MDDTNEDAPLEGRDVKRARSEQVARDTAAFMASGGKVRELPPCTFTDPEHDYTWHRLEYGVTSLFDGRAPRADRSTKK